MIKITVKKSKTPRFPIDFSDDPLYLEGVKEGVRRKSIYWIEKMLLQGSFSIKDIIEISDQTEYFVLAVQNRLIEEGKLPPLS